MRRWVLLAGVLATAAAQTTFQKPPAGAERSLRDRVERFYSLYQQEKFREAESLVAQESRDAFYTMPKNPVKAFRVESITWANDYRSAEVLVACESVSPLAGSGTVKIPVRGSWKQLENQWYLVVERRPPPSLPPSPVPERSQSLEGFGATQPGGPDTPNPLPAGRPLFSVEPRTISFPRDAAAVTERTVIISNRMPGPLQLVLGAMALPGLSASLSSPTVQAFGYTTLKISYDPARGRPAGQHSVGLLIQPISQPVAITVRFE